MKLGLVSAILPDLSLSEILEFAAVEKYTCVEVEDRAYEDTLERRKDSLCQSCAYLRNLIPG